MTREGVHSRRMPGQYGSNGLRADGTSFNVGNKLGQRPSIRLFAEYNQGAAMEALLAQADEIPISDLGRRELPAHAEGAAGAGGASGGVEAAAPAAAPAPPPPAAAPAPRTELDLEWGQQRLLGAVRANRARDLRAALEDGADVKRAEAGTGCTPLHVAAECGRPRMCELLLELGAEVDVRNKAGERPADVAKTAEIRELLKIKC